LPFAKRFNPLQLQSLFEHRYLAKHRHALRLVNKTKQRPSINKSEGAKISPSVSSLATPGRRLSYFSYFNLKDAGASDILGHELMIKANKFTPVDVMSP